MTRHRAAGRPRAQKPAGGSRRPPPTRLRSNAARRSARADATIKDIVLAALDDLKAANVCVLDVRSLTDVTDTIIIACGTSDRHVKSLAARVLERAQLAGLRALGIEGQREGDWVLVDLQDVIVHLMLPRVREFYGLEKLWGERVDERAVNA